MHQRMIDNICNLAITENKLRDDLENIYNELMNLVEIEDEVNTTFNSFCAPKHLDLLNMISIELKKESYIPKCINKLN